MADDEIRSGPRPRFFSFDGESGFSEHSSSLAAKKAAEEALDDVRSRASDGWDDSTESICWGEIRQVARVPHVRRERRWFHSHAMRLMRRNRQAPGSPAPGGTMNVIVLHPNTSAGHLIRCAVESALAGDEVMASVYIRTAMRVLAMERKRRMMIV